jgi:hypothetical protein
VPLETRLETLYMRTHRLAESLGEVRTTIREDHPSSDDSVLVDMFGDAVDDLLGWVAESQDSVLAAQQALTVPINVDHVRKGLLACHQTCQRVEHRFVCDVVRYERIAGLMRLGRERGGEWRAWAAGVKEGLERCHQPLADLDSALLDCWLDLSERSVDTGLSIETGQARAQGG